MLVCGQYGDRFYTKRKGLRWCIVEVGQDGIHREHATKFWSWLSAARTAGEMLRIWHDGIWIGENADPDAE